MKTKGFLIVGKNGSLRAVKSIRGAVEPDCVAIALDLTVPDSAFKPIITAKIDIDEKDIHPLLIKAGKFKQMEEVLSQEIGMKVVLTTIDTVKPEKKSA